MEDKFLVIITILCFIGTFIATIIWGWLVLALGIFLTFVIIGTLAPDDNEQRDGANVHNVHTESHNLYKKRNTYNYENIYRDYEQDEEDLYGFNTIPKEIDCLLEEEFYCERCGEQITEEEYIDGAGLCEDCDTDVFLGIGDDCDLYR